MTCIVSDSIYLVQSFNNGSCTLSLYAGLVHMHLYANPLNNKPSQFWPTAGIVLADVSKPFEQFICPEDSSLPSCSDASGCGVY